MTYSLESTRTKLAHLPKGLIEHCERVRSVCLDLTRRFGCDGEKAQFVALAHDVARAMKGEELLSRAQEFGLLISPLEQRMPILIHGPVGAEILRRDWSILDEDVLEAVKWHTTAKAEMGLLAKVLFLADKLEPGKDRRYPFNDRVRRLVERDLDEALLEFLNGELGLFIEHGDPIHPTTIEARNFLVMQRRESTQAT